MIFVHLTRQLQHLRQTYAAKTALFLKRLSLQVRIHIARIDIDDMEQILKQMPYNNATASLIDRLTRLYRHLFNLQQELDELK